MYQNEKNLSISKPTEMSSSLDTCGSTVILSYEAFMYTEILLLVKTM